MSETAAGGPASSPPDPNAGTAAVPGGLVAAVVDLVNTGPVLLGAYTLAELTAVDAIVDFLEARPSDEVLAEAVRSLSARQLLVAGTNGDGQVQVRGDLGIAVAFQQRARTVLDARTTGTAAGEPWRTLLLPQPEHIVLVFRIDALGVHEIGLYPSDKALDDLVDWLPKGDRADPGDEAAEPGAVIAAADRSALVTVTGTPPTDRPRPPGKAATWSSPTATTGCTSLPAARAVWPRWSRAPGTERTSARRSPACWSSDPACCH